MKKTLLFLMLVCGWYTVRSQTGASCSSSIPIGSPPTCEANDTINAAVKWYSFVATANGMQLTSTLTSATSGYVQKLEVYSGTCTGLTLVASDTMTATNDGILTAPLNGLTASATYFVKLTKLGSTSAVYDLCLVEPLSPRITVSVNGGPLCKMSNGCGIPPIDPNDTIFKDCNIDICVNAPTEFCFSQFWVGPGFDPFNTLDYTFPGSDIGPFHYDHSSTSIPRCFMATWSLAGDYVCNFIHYNFDDCGGVYYVIRYTVHVVDNPVASMTASGSPFCENGTACFTSTSIGQNLTYTWTTGSYNCTSGCTGVFCIPSLDLGPQNCTLTVTNSCGPSIAVQTINVNPPVASFSAATNCTTTFTDLSTCQSNIFSWAWNFGDAGTSTLQNPTHTYATAGTYTVTLTITDNNGFTSVSTQSIVVNPQPTFIIVGSTTSCVQSGGSTTYFPSLTAPYTGVTYTWSTSTGATGTGASASVNFYPNGGTITFVGTATGGCTYSTTLYVGSCCIAENSLPTYTNATVLGASNSMQSTASFGTLSGGIFTVTGKIFSINGTFTVNENLVLQGCKVTMGYLAKIIVSPGKKITITNSAGVESHIYSCNEMWDGIYATASTATVVVNNGSTIEDALNAIVATNTANFQITGNLANGKVIFNKNFKSIVVYNALSGSYPGFVRGAVFQCYDGVVGGNPVNTSHLLRYPHTTKRSYVGVDITDVNSITVGSSASTLYLNKFDNLDYGILSINSSVSAYNNDFRNITTPPGLPTVKGEECYPGTAICSKGNNFSTARTLTVGTSAGGMTINNFNNCGKGIVGSAFLHMNIWKNTFTGLKIGIRSANNSFRTSIVNQNVISGTLLAVDFYNNVLATCTIDDNDVFAGGLANSIGVQATEIIPGATVYKITRNNINSVRYGIVASALKSSFIEENNVNLTHTVSSADACYGIRLTGSNLCNVNTNVINGTNGNDWWVTGINLDLCYSDNIVCNEVHNVGTGLLFGGTQTPNTYIANNLMDNNYRGLTLGYSIVGPQTASTSPPNDNRWTGTHTWHSYSFFSPGGLSPFYVRNVTGMYNPAAYLAFTSTPFDEIDLIPIAGLNNITCPFVMHSTEGGGEMGLMMDIAEDSIQPLAYEEPTRFMLKQSLYQYLKTDSTAINDNPILANFQNEQAVGNIGKLDDAEQLSADPTDMAALLSAQATNAGVIPSNDAEINSKWMNEVLIGNALAGNQFSDPQLADLRILAAKCPYNDGLAVHQARAILSQVEDTLYRNVCEDFIDGSRSMQNPRIASSNEGLRLFPNPNNGSMNLIYSLNEGSSGSMVIYDLNGKAIVTHALRAGANNQLLINETKLSAGVFFYKVTIDDKVKMSDKLVIIK